MVRMLDDLAQDPSLGSSTHKVAPNSSREFSTLFLPSWALNGHILMQAKHNTQKIQINESFLKNQSLEFPQYKNYSI